MTQQRDQTYITAHFIEHEISHLTRMIRSRHWHGSKVWTVAYWRARLIELQSAPVITPAQRSVLYTLVNFLYFFPDDPVRSIVGGIIATAAPYAMYRLAREVYGLNASLSNLTAGRLMLLTIAYAIAGPLLHNIWFYLSGDSHDIVSRFLAMVVGDFAGTVIVIYTLKAALYFLPVPQRSNPDH